MSARPGQINARGRRLVVNLNNKKGITLIEIIIAIAILSIVVIVFLTVFSFGFKSIVTAGDRTSDMFEVQSNIENSLTQKYNGTTPASVGQITIDGGSIVPQGIVTSKIVNGVEIWYFMPSY